MDIFHKKLEKLLHSAKFFKLFLIKILWNITSSKFQIFIVCIIFRILGYIDQTSFLIACGIYAGARVLDSIGGNFGKGKNDNNN